ncbi:TetR/AcrR family transcriptional regulator [Streptomyces sp. NPDC001739]
MDRHEQVDRRGRVLDAAVELIARDGFDGVRIADVARQAGVSTALVHYHFAHRAQLLTEALTHSLSRAEQRLARSAGEVGRAGADRRLADLIDFALPFTDDDVREARLWAELESRAAGSPELAEALARLNRRTEQPVADAVAAGLAEGIFHDCVPAEVATAAQALLAGLSVRLTAHDPGLDLAGVRELAGRQLSRLVGYAGVLPFRPLSAVLPESGTGTATAPDAITATATATAPDAATSTSTSTDSVAERGESTGAGRAAVGRRRRAARRPAAGH